MENSFFHGYSNIRYRFYFSSCFSQKDRKQVTCEPVKKRIVFTPADQRPRFSGDNTLMQSLGKDLSSNSVQPFILHLNPDMGNGTQMIVHTGYEFAYCLSGTIRYRIGEEDFLLKSGDSLVFESHLPHCWINAGQEIAHILLILFSSDEKEEIGGHHFLSKNIKKEINMRKKNKSSLIATFLTLFIIPLSVNNFSLSCKPDLNKSVEDEFQKTISISAPIELEINISQGNINITRGNDKELKINSKYKVLGTKEEELKIIAENIKKDPPIDIKSNKIKIGNLKKYNIDVVFRRKSYYGLGYIDSSGNYCYCRNRSWKCKYNKSCK